MSRGQVRRRVKWVLWVAASVTVAVVVGAPPGIAVRSGAYVVGAMVVEALVLSLGPAAPRPSRSPFEAVAHPRPVDPPPEPETLHRLRREASLATQSSGGWHYRLRPVVRDITTVLLEDRAGIDLDGQPDAARAHLGAPVWERLRPDAPSPDDRWAPGVDPAELDHLVDRIEQL